MFKTENEVIGGLQKGLTDPGCIPYSSKIISGY